MRHARSDALGRLAPVLHTDVLVLGAGLAGMRAAIAARQAAPALRVTLVSPRARASGSSFANRNNALGMQAPLPGQEDLFVAEALRLAAPGHAAPSLAAALAEDAPARLDDLLGLGLCFRREEDGRLRRFPGCFSSVPRAVVFDGLAQAHAAFLAQARALGVELLFGFEALALLQQAPGGRVAGARLCALRGQQTLRIHAGAVVAALGGPAPLFARRICGPGGSGLAYGLLASAGARLVNTGFVQWFWVEAKGLDFVNPGELAWPEPLAHLAGPRRQHCPMAYGLSDAALDLDLLARQGPGGLTRAEHTQRGALDLALAAHAGNGGALIDAQGRTSVEGLYACGECASGMHGANRLGGGMVLAALVFGARAGRAAAQEAGGQAGGPAGGRTQGTAPAEASGAEQERQDNGQALLRWLGRGMQRFGTPGAEQRTQASARQAFRARLRAVLEDAQTGLRSRLLARSALAVLEGADQADLP
ncbi:MAG: FAD-binding protein [Proteobacteria bacterium]|nr:FAD-binding protein [Pseudomonadota bacterium]